MGSLKPNEVDDLEPLRMVAVDGSDWGLESSSALVAIEEGSVGEGQQVEELVSVASEVSGYEKWENSYLNQVQQISRVSNCGIRE